MVHVEDILVTEALYVLAHIHDLLEILILPVTEDGVVHYDAVHFVVVVGFDECIFKIFSIYFSKLEAESTARAMSLVLKKMVM